MGGYTPHGPSASTRAMHGLDVSGRDAVGKPRPQGNANQATSRQGSSENWWGLLEARPRVELG